jgi:3-oxoacyl-[acyl-carrier protein] reductase
MLKGKTALVTGASRGIGREIAKALAKMGANIAVVYAGNEQAANETCELIEMLGVKAEVFQCDVSNFEQAKTCVAEVTKLLGGVDILVNNAGVNADGLCMRMTEQQWDVCIDTNLKGAFNMIRHVSPLMVRKKAGRIINVTSVAGILGNAGQVNYASSKAGLIGMTKSVAREFASRGITCNAVAPGLIETDMAKELPDNVKDEIIGSVPLKRMGRAQEVAELIAYLATDSAAYITGAVIPIDGGMSM